MQNVLTPFFPNGTSRYPVITVGKDGNIESIKTFVPVHKKLLQKGDSIDAKMSIIQKYIGAVITNRYDFNRITYVKPPKSYQIHLTPTMGNNVPKFIHGWFDFHSQLAIEGAIQIYQPKTVVELGVWLGQASMSILSASKKPINYWGFEPYYIT